MRKLYIAIVICLLLALPAQAAYEDGKVDDTAYNATSWDNVTTIAPSKNAVRDKFESLSADNSTANNIIAKDSNGAIGNVTLDAHLSRTGTTTQALGVVTPSVDGSAHVHLTAAQMSGNGVIVTNYGQTTADVVIGLPTAAAGLSGLFTVATAQSNHWGVLADTNDKIYLIAAAGTVAAGSDAAAAVMVAAQLGQAFACWSFQSGNGTWDWMCKAVCIGTSTFEAHAAL